MFEKFIYEFLDFVDPVLVKGDFDACLILVIATPEQIIDAHNCLAIGQKIRL